MIRNMHIWCIIMYGFSKTKFCLTKNNDNIRWYNFDIIKSTFKHFRTVLLTVKSNRTKKMIQFDQNKMLRTKIIQDLLNKINF